MSTLVAASTSPAPADNAASTATTPHRLLKDRTIAFYANLLLRSVSKKGGPPGRVVPHRFLQGRVATQGNTSGVREGEDWRAIAVRKQCTL